MPTYLCSHVCHTVFTGTVVLVTALLLVTEKQQRISWVLTHYQVW